MNKDTKKFLFLNPIKTSIKMTTFTFVKEIICRPPGLHERVKFLLTLAKQLNAKKISSNKCIHYLRD